MGKTRDLFKKIRDIKGTFHGKIGTIKERNRMDLTGAEDIKKKWQKYTEELYKKDLHDPDNHSPRVRHLQCEVKWALGIIITNNLVEVMEFQLSCESAARNMPANLENSAVAKGQEKFSFHSNPKERQCQRMFKLLHNCSHLTH